MTTVTASPSAIGELRAVLGAAADTLTTRSRRVGDALESFFASGSELGPTRSLVPEILAHQARSLDMVAESLRRFVVALRAADLAGEVVTSVPFGWRPGTDVVAVAEATLERYTPLTPGATLSDLIGQTQRRRDALAAREPPPGGGAAQRRRWAARLADLDNRLSQYRAYRSPPHPGWARAWPAGGLAAADYLAGVQATTHATWRLGPPTVHRRPGLGRGLADAVAWRAFARDHPFLAASRTSGALLTPDRLRIVQDLDRLATMPLDDFLAARASARTARPWYDWSADGCSGPIPARARDACLRHDFLYRNARMLRDQWGLHQDFPLVVKDVADDRFGDELHGFYRWWELLDDPLVAVWIESAEVAVELRGDVRRPWRPPLAGRFYGDVTPNR